MVKNYRKTGFVVVLICLALVFGFYFFNLDYAKASPGTVEFGPEDVILDLTGLDTTTYVASGSKCDSLTISGTDLTVNGVWDGIPFLLKTAGHKVLEITPSAGTADFKFSSANVSDGYVNEWKETSSINVTHKVGVPTADNYIVKVNGAVLGAFPGPEINFTRAGTGVEETYTIHPPPCEYHNVYGWAWSDNIGWISFSCGNCDSDFDGNLDGGSCGSGSSADYGVDVDVFTGLFSGYAWSENIGWISFEPADVNVADCPDSPASCQAEIDLSTRVVSGWAKALVAAGGWDGWIKLRGLTNEAVPQEYGVSLNSTLPTSEFEGWAWGDVVVGWVSFNCINAKICSITDQVCITDGDCPGIETCENPTAARNACLLFSDYKVMTDVDFPPYIEPGSTNIQYEEYCNNSPIGQVGFEWTYQDDGDNQAQYKLQVATDSGFINKAIDCIIDQGGVLPGETGTSAVTVVSSPSDVCNDGELLGSRSLQINYTGPGTTYYWRVNVKAATGNLNWSGWQSGPTTFSTSSNPYPNPSFGWDPLSPPAEVEVTFTDTSTCYTGVANCKNDGDTLYQWDFDNDSVIDDVTKPDGTPITHTYLVAGPYTVRLYVTDTIDLILRTCYQEEPLTATLPLPEWKEIAPF